MSDEERKVGFGPVWRARIIGDATGHLTTSGPILAEPMRIRILRGKLSLTSRVSSLTVETLTYLMSCCLMIAAALLALIATFAVSWNLRAVSIMVVTLLLLVVASTIVIAWRRWPVASDLGLIGAKLLGTIGLGGKFDRQLLQLVELEKRVFNFYAERPRDFIVVALWHALFHVCGVVETYATLQFIGFDTSPLAAFTLEGANRVINVAFSFVPGRLGVDEAGSGLLAQTLGLGTTAGVSLALIRKGRVLFWTIVGLIFFAFSKPDEHN